MKQCQSMQMNAPEKDLSTKSTVLKLASSPITSTRVRRRWGESFIYILLAASALVSVLTTLAIIFVLGKESLNFFSVVAPMEFFTGTRWVPLLDPASFGVLPLLWGTLAIAVGAGLIAIPVGLAAAIYLSEYATERVRLFLKPLLELLAGIPTIVYGYFALTFVTPLLQTWSDKVHVFNAVSAAIVVGIMVLPMIITLSDNALRAVPMELRQGAYALGATSLEVTSRVVVPAGFGSVMAAFLLAISRAIGETMAVTIAAGATPSLSLNMLDSIQTMTAYIVQVSLGDTPVGGIAYQTLFAVASLLFVITLLINLLAQWITKRYREQYEL